MYELQLLSVVLTLTCVVGDYTCLDNGTVTQTTFGGCEASDALLESHADGQGEVQQVVVCKSLTDTALALAGIGEWSADMCPTVNKEPENENGVICPLLYNSDKWSEALLALAPIKAVEGCQAACGKVACEQLLVVVGYAQESLRKRVVHKGRAVKTSKVGWGEGE